MPNDLKKTFETEIEENTDLTTDYMEKINKSFFLMLKNPTEKEIEKHRKIRDALISAWLASFFKDFEKQLYNSAQRGIDEADRQLKELGIKESEKIEAEPEKIKPYDNSPIKQTEAERPKSGTIEPKKTNSEILKEDVEIKSDDFENQLENQISESKLELQNTANSIKINSEKFINEWFKKRREEFYRRAWVELSDKVNRGITYFEDRAGRKWDIVNYIDMKTQTEFAKAYREAFLLRAIQYKIDLVRIMHLNYHPTCPLCSPFENKILSIRGKTKGYMTVDEAANYGLFHPRCDHIEEFELITEKMPRKKKKKYKKERLQKDGVIELNEANKTRYKYNKKNL